MKYDKLSDAPPFSALKYYLLVPWWYMSALRSRAGLAAVGLAGMNESAICCACGDAPSCIVFESQSARLMQPLGRWVGGGGVIFLFSFVIYY